MRPPPRYPADVATTVPGCLAGRVVGAVREPPSSTIARIGERAVREPPLRARFGKENGT